MTTQALTVSFVQPGSAAGSLQIAAIDGDLGLIESKIESADAQRGQYLARKYGSPNIVAEGVFDNGSATATVSLVDLTSLGVTFPATTKRRIRWIHYVQTDNDLYQTEYERWILGGTTPLLLGSRVVKASFGDVAGTVYAYGDVQLHATTSGGTVTVDTATTSAGVSLGNFTSGAATLTFGPCRATPYVNFWHYAEDAGTIGDFRTLQVRALATAGTATVETATTNGTEAVTSPNGVNNIDIGLHILPPGDADLALSTNNVQLQITGIASDETRHRVEIFVGPTVLVPFQGS